MDTIQIILLAVFVVATIVGYKLINNVPSLLHTPLMSGMNALSGVTVLGALTAAALIFHMFGGVLGEVLSATCGVLAIALAMINVVGGFAVTDRMLKMIAKKADATAKKAYVYVGVISVLILGATIAIAFIETVSITRIMYYSICAALSVLVLVGIALMSKVKLSVVGNRLSAICMALGVLLTLIYNAILPIWTLYVGLVLGGVIGYILAKRVKMIQMPQMVALLNGLGGAASAIVGAFAMFGVGTGLDIFSCVTSALALAVGMLTLTGSLVAAGKLHKVLPQKPIIYKGHQAMTTGSLIGMVISLALYVVFVVVGNSFFGALPIVFAVLTLLLSSFFGFIFAIRVGGADMPITISLLNSFSGVAGAIAGLAISDLLLVAVGGIVGASGLLLTQIMCRSMNRHIMDILLGKTSAQPSAKPAVKQAEPKKEEIKEEKVEVVTNSAAELKGAKEVIIVPGYGMAIAQAQHLVKQLADKLRANGTTIKYAIHPVAGRMPGHMNVLLCEADVDYEDLYEMDNINPEFEKADATIVVGANDVLNPAAREAEGTPIYGMPVLSVDQCKKIFIFNYDLKPGYAGVENPLYTRESGVYKYLGNASETLATFIADVDKPASIEVKKEAKTAEKVEVESNPAAELKGAKEVIIVPGYGMAIAQAQHLVKQLADKLRANGTTIKYAIHPVAGRMPGHMNVLLCEADVDYEDLYEMDNINPEFEKADATIVVGANDVLNPAAREAEGTPIYGMPVLSVDQCKKIFIFNYDLKPGYAGVENPLYTRESGVYKYLGNASETLATFIADVDKPASIEVKKEAKTAEKVEVESNPAAELKGAKEVIIVPGYGMAIAQAQHLVKQLADKLRANGTTIKYAIHPVAGRMPGHMNVLLCEADVDYEDLYEMDNINPEFEKADATIVVGANDVLNPAAREAEGTPIYGMPVLSVDQCKKIFIFNYDLKPGYAGVENPLYTRESGVWLYLGNASETLAKFIASI